jgi:diguanylate cyclase (GGDEF)-like protein/PAS domain S-box-containing protein
MDDKIYLQIMDILSDGVYFVDTDRKVTFWNQGAEELTGIGRDDILGRHCFDDLLVHIDSDGKSLCDDGCILAETLADGEAREADLFLLHGDGHRIPVSVRTSAFTDDSGEVIGAVEIFSDNSVKIAAKRRIDELERLALLDELTRIGNRRYLEMTLRAKLAETARYNSQVGIFFMDIDHFKEVNDQYGHDAGDRVLKAIASTLMGIIRPTDLAGRWGGEEFVAAVSNVNRKTLKPIAERFRKLIEEAIVRLPDEEIHFTVSVGATMAKEDEALEDVIKRADQLMYRSKEAGRNQVTVG